MRSSAVMSKVARRLGTVPSVFVIAIQLWACAAKQRPATAESPAMARPLDRTPRSVPTKSSLPERTALAFFALNTGGDQMTLSRKQAGLEAVVRYQDKELRQTIASCSDPSLGSALGGGTDRELEVAFCDGEFWLIAEPGRITVERKDQPTVRVVSSIPLPWPTVRARHPSNP